MNVETIRNFIIVGVIITIILLIGKEVIDRDREMLLNLEIDALKDCGWKNYEISCYWVWPRAYCEYECLEAAD